MNSDQIKSILSREKSRYRKKELLRFRIKKTINNTPVFLFLFIVLFSSQLQALYRNYNVYSGSIYSDSELPFDSDLLEYIPYFRDKEWYHIAYLGYIDTKFAKYLPHFASYLLYCHHHPECECLWPEYSGRAAEISNVAYILFSDLISKTALSNLLVSRQLSLHVNDNYDCRLQPFHLVESGTGAVATATHRTMPSPLLRMQEFPLKPLRQ